MSTVPCLWTAFQWSSQSATVIPLHHWSKQKDIIRIENKWYWYRRSGPGREKKEEKEGEKKRYRRIWLSLATIFLICFSSNPLFKPCKLPFSLYCNINTFGLKQRGSGRDQGLRWEKAKNILNGHCKRKYQNYYQHAFSSIWYDQIMPQARLSNFILQLHS